MADDYNNDELEEARELVGEMLAALQQAHWYYDAFRDSSPRGMTELDDIARHAANTNPPTEMIEAEGFRTDGYTLLDKE